MIDQMKSQQFPTYYNFLIFHGIITIDAMGTQKRVKTKRLNAAMDQKYQEEVMFG